MEERKMLTPKEIANHERRQLPKSLRKIMQADTYFAVSNRKNSFSAESPITIIPGTGAKYILVLVLHICLMKSKIHLHTLSQGSRVASLSLTHEVRARGRTSSKARDTSVTSVSVSQCAGSSGLLTIQKRDKNPTLNREVLCAKMRARNEPTGYNGIPRPLVCVAAGERRKR